MPSIVARDANRDLTDVVCPLYLLGNTRRPPADALGGFHRPQMAVLILRAGKMQDGRNAGEAFLPAVPILDRLMLMYGRLLNFPPKSAYMYALDISGVCNPSVERALDADLASGRSLGPMTKPIVKVIRRLNPRNLIITSVGAACGVAARILMDSFIRDTCRAFVCVLPTNLPPWSRCAPSATTPPPPLVIVTNTNACPQFSNWAAASSSTAAALRPTPSNLSATTTTGSATGGGASAAASRPPATFAGCVVDAAEVIRNVVGGGVTSVDPSRGSPSDAMGPASASASAGSSSMGVAGVAVSSAGSGVVCGAGLLDVPGGLPAVVAAIAAAATVAAMPNEYAPAVKLLSDAIRRGLSGALSATKGDDGVVAAPPVQAPAASAAAAAKRTEDHDPAVEAKVRALVTATLCGIRSAAAAATTPVSSSEGRRECVALAPVSVLESGADGGTLLRVAMSGLVEALLRRHDCPLPAEDGEGAPAPQVPLSRAAAAAEAYAVSAEALETEYAAYVHKVPPFSRQIIHVHDRMKQPIPMLEGGDESEDDSDADEEDADAACVGSCDGEEAWETDEEI